MVTTYFAFASFTPMLAGLQPGPPSPPAWPAWRETEETFVAELPIPAGLGKRHLSVVLDADRIRVRGERRPRRFFQRAPRETLSFEAELTLPRGADPDEIHAGFRDGVLSLVADKRPGARRRLVAIRYRGARATSPPVLAPRPEPRGPSSLFGRLRALWRRLSDRVALRPPPAGSSAGR